MKDIWLAQYPRGVRSDIDLTQYNSLNDLVAQSCLKYPKQVAWRQMGGRLLYREYDALASALAGWLQSLPGLEPGARIAMMLPNCLQYPVAILAALRTGLIIVNVNPMYTPGELQHQLEDSGARALIVLENFAHIAQQSLDKTDVRHVITTGLGDLLPFPRRTVVNYVLTHVKKVVPRWEIAGAVPFRNALNYGRVLKLRPAQPRQQDIALLQYTGGTTGVSKGAVLTHGNLLANVLQLNEWTRAVLREAAETWVAALPMYHINSFLISFLNVRIGGCGLLIANPRDSAGLVQELQHTPPTTMTGVNTLFRALLNTAGFRDIDWSGLRFVAGGAAAIHEGVAGQWLAVTGRQITQGYGLTESSGVATVNVPDAPFNGSVGLPLPSTDVAIFDEDGQALPPGSDGEVCLRGPQITSGYWRRPEETAAAFTPGGWFRTGDIGKLDRQGLLYITDRKKDMINVSGLKVFPNEVEAVICALAGIVDCGVVGSDDGMGNEVVRAVVQRSSESVTIEAITAHCRKHLTAYKVPKIVEFRDSLPKSAIGKVLRRELRT